jgi:hypothetical protein
MVTFFLCCQQAVAMLVAVISSVNHSKMLPTSNWYLIAVGPNSSSVMNLIGQKLVFDFCERLIGRSKRAKSKLMTGLNVS